MQQLFSLANKVIIITGATGVLGEAFVKAVAEMGGKVVLIGRNEEVGNMRPDKSRAPGDERSRTHEFSP